VTGGAGFIGSHLVGRLIAEGHQVTVADDFSSGRKENLRSVAGHRRLRVVQHDVTNPLHVEVDRIYHLACPASPVFYQRDRVKTTKTAVVGSLNMLDLAAALDCRILLASTSEVYGDALEHPQTESYWGNVNPIGPRACYDEGKRCAESLFFDYHRQYGVPIKVARLFNTYGPRMRPDDGRVIASFIEQAMSGADISMYGDGSQTRSFCYVDDLVNGLVSLMESPEEVTGPINLGNPTEFTIRELAELVMSLTGSTASLVSLPRPLDEPSLRCPAIDRARSVLGWEPRVTLSEGLERTIRSIETELSRPLASAG
jgi:UDP-glucuronate decarboxylase